ncbi:MAG TPA: DUF2510 domain-containing protein [Ilumatobacter sp.]|nr:DUF2510 domain-containing protein [Ilumatobacter sp.]
MEAGWYPDPTGRFARRYHDGAYWTEHVETDGSVTADFEGRTALSVPSTLAPPVVEPSPPAAGPSLTEFAAGLGPEPRQRPAVHLSAVLAGFGGAFAAVGLLALAADGLDSSGPLIILGLVAIGVGLAARLAPALNQHDFFRDAGTGAGLVGVFATAAGFSAATGGDSGVRLGYAAAAVLLFGLWAAPGYRERPTFFGLGVSALVAFVADLFRDTDPYDDYYGSYDDDWFDEWLGDLGNVVTRTGAVYLVLGLLLLALVLIADRKGFHGLGTGLAVNAIAASVVGAFMLLPRFNDVGGAFLVALVGAGLGIVGALGGRRATTWIGGTLCSLATLSALAVMFEPTSTEGVAAVAFVAAAVLIGVVPLVRYVRAQQRAGDIAAD